MVTSRAVVGSSAIRISGLQASAIAIITRCLWPPESWNGYSSTIFSALGRPVIFRSSMVRLRASSFDSFSCERRFSATCFPIFMTGFREVIGSWKIMLMREPRSCLRFSSSYFVMSSPSRRISPSVTLPVVPMSRPMMESEVTLFPEPDSPTSPSVCPF